MSLFPFATVQSLLCLSILTEFFADAQTYSHDDFWFWLENWYVSQDKNEVGVVGAPCLYRLKEDAAAAPFKAVWEKQCEMGEGTTLHSRYLN